MASLNASGAALPVLLDHREHRPHDRAPDYEPHAPVASDRRVDAADDDHGTRRGVPSSGSSSLPHFQSVELLGYTGGVRHRAWRL